MKEKSTILAVLLIAAMFAMLIIPAVKAWEYSDTWIHNAKTDNLVEYFGPRADVVNIVQYSNEGQEFAALQSGLLDITDWPITVNEYTPWTTPPLNNSIAVVNTGPEFGLYLLDLRCNNDTYIQVPTSGTPVYNPAFNPSYGNPMADVWLRRAISCVNDRPYFADVIYSGNQFPRLATAIYNDLSPAYKNWADPGLAPGLTQYVYCDASGAPNVTQGNAYLDAHGYTYSAAQDCRLSQGGTYKFSIEFIVRLDDWHRLNAATFPGGVVDLMTKAPPNGLGLKNNLIVTQKNSGGAKTDFMDTKKAHMYTGGWGLTIDPDHLYYLFSKVGYWHPGRPNNYAGYPGDLHDEYTVTVANWKYSGFPGNYSWTGTEFDFSDTVDDPLGVGDPDGYWTAPKYRVGDVISQNPANYWTRQMMVATTLSRAQYCAYKAQEFLAYWACGVPWWAAASNTAFARKYTGGGLAPGPSNPETPYIGHFWEGVVDQAGFGVWSTASFYNMHTDNAEIGDGAHMVIRQGFRQPTLSLNPCYAEWVWDWYVLNLEVDGMITADPYTLKDAPNLATSWELSTWNNTVGNPKGTTCTNVTFHMRSDLFWSDGVPITASDVKFTWGGPAVTGSISNYVAKRGLPPTYWSANLLDIMSISTPDPWTVNVLLDTYAYFGLHSMSGFNIVLPEHIWKPQFATGTPTWQWDGPQCVSGPWILEHNWDPSAHGSELFLDKNVKHNMLFPDSNPPLPVPVIVSSIQTSNATTVIGNMHWIYPNKNQYTVQLTDNVTMHNYYVYRTGPNSTQSYPYTKLDGLKTVKLYKLSTKGPMDWNLTYANVGVYTLNQTVETNVPVDLIRCEDFVETLPTVTLNSGWYYYEISLNITSLAYSTDNGTTWIPVTNTALNPFYNHVKVYKEYFVVTSRYDIGGSFWKPQQGNLQIVPDLHVNVVDTFTAAIAFGSQPGFANWNPAVDVNGDNKVNLQDTFAINLAYGSVF